MMRTALRYIAVLTTEVCIFSSDCTVHRHSLFLRLIRRRCTAFDFLLPEHTMMRMRWRSADTDYHLLRAETFLFAASAPLTLVHVVSGCQVSDTATVPMSLSVYTLTY